ncbi:hypothetical protein TPL01_15760 [Sulfuriferula plumbiphila]|uniref:DUF883 domain-containing protein n=1 Tax=Sulfuriferula plumbiphila TaxID=171865 RepID=A0A512L7H9_9PROT|nr:DUF883 family protein [Sulfuriferula plumbiphila]BBP04045.1 hypothetical protein SFPGR_14670 [Sulfuriferula plumbiphila]GEP30438.1 hypothetical protein TPL01_15760 [Sulfuriferula plumbiphila]
MNTNRVGTETDLTDITKDQLISDFKVVIADAEALLKVTANQGGEALAAARTKAEASLAIAKAKIAEAQDALMERTRAAARATDDYVHENPWRAVGVAAGVGLVVGLLVGRR